MTETFSGLDANLNHSQSTGRYLCQRVGAAATLADVKRAAELWHPLEGTWTTKCGGFTYDNLVLKAVRKTRAELVHAEFNTLGSNSLDGPAYVISKCEASGGC